MLDRKEAYITLLCTDDYINGVIALNEGLKKTGATRPLLCLVDETLSQETFHLLKVNGIETIMKPIIPVDEQIKEFNKRHGLGVWNTIFQKLWVFALTEYDKVVYLDGDLFIVKNPDELFDYPHLSFCQDPAITFKVPKWEGFTSINAGVMVIEPFEPVFDDLIGILNSKKDREWKGDLSDVVCDQSIIDEYIHNEYAECPKWLQESPKHTIMNDKYNVFMGYFDRYTHILEKDVVIIHLAGSPDVKFFMPQFNKDITKRFTDKMYKYSSMYFSMLEAVPEEKRLILPTISIIIPRYSETEKVLGSLLSDLNTQIGINFNQIEVLVCEDCPETPIPIEFYSQFSNLKLKRLLLDKNVGPGLARQTGISISKGKYLMFVDADDRIFTCLALKKVIEFINGYPNTDIFYGIFLEEGITDRGEVFYVPKSNITWLHAKIYKKEFIEKIELNFPQEIRVNEDSYFNAIAFTRTEQVTYIQEILTVWSRNPNSLSRFSNGALGATGWPDYITGRFLVMEALRGKVPLDKWQKALVQYLTFLYLYAQKNEWTSERYLEVQERVDKMSWEFRKKYYQDYKLIPRALIEGAYNQMRVATFPEGIFMEKESFFDYYARLSDKYGSYESSMS